MHSVGCAPYAVVVVSWKGCLLGEGSAPGGVCSVGYPSMHWTARCKTITFVTSLRTVTISQTERNNHTPTTASKPKTLDEGLQGKPPPPPPPPTDIITKRSSTNDTRTF